MYVEKEDDLTTLLDLDSEEQPPVEPGGEKPPEPEAPKPGEINNRVNQLEKSNKDATELIRQQSEQIKELSDFKNRIVGNTDEEVKKKTELELRQRFEEDPLAVMHEIAASKIEEVKTPQDLDRVSNQVYRIASEIDKDYEVNWDKDYEKIIAEMNNFSKESKTEDLKKVILKSCNLARVIKKRVSSPPPSTLKGGGFTGNPSVDKGEAEKIKNRIVGKVQKKSRKTGNVFGI